MFSAWSILSQFAIHHVCRLDLEDFLQGMQNASVPQHIGQVGRTTCWSRNPKRGGSTWKHHESRDRVVVCRHQNGVMWTEANVQGLTQTTSSPVSLTWSGSLLLRLKSKKFSLTVAAFGPHTQGSDLREAPWRASRSSLPQSLLPLVLTRSVFGCCSFVAFGAIFPCLPLAGVANHLILVAITGEFVLTQGSWAAVGFLWRVALPICREACARVSQNIRVQDLDLLPVPRVDNRRLEVVADGLPLFHGAQLDIDTTMVSVVRADGVP